MALLEKYFRISQAAGVSVRFNNDGSTHVSACLVSIKNNQLEIAGKVPDLATVYQLKNHLPPKTFIALNLSGKGILHKKIDKVNEINQNNFNLILPNANQADFYIQNFISGDYSFVSVIRKSEADKLIVEMREIGFITFMLSLGPFPIQNIVSQLNIYDQDIIFNGNVIQRDEQFNWKSYRYEDTAFAPFALKVELENMDEKLIVAYAAVFQLVLASKLDVINTEVPSLETAFNKKIEDNRIKVYGFIVLAGLFIFLLANLFVFSWLGSSNTQLAIQVSQITQNTTDMQKVSETIKHKEDLLFVLGWEEGFYKSILIDQIAAMLPSEITWKEIGIDPIDLNSTRTQKELVFFSRQIRITGSSDKIIPVNEWIARIKTKSWVKDIQLESYIYNNELNTGQFIIIINY